MDVNKLVNLLVFALGELGGPLEHSVTETVERYACEFPFEMIIACAYVKRRYLV